MGVYIQPYPPTEAVYQLPKDSYDVTPDGRVLTVAVGVDLGSRRRPVRLQLVLNWFEELKQRVPSK